MNTLTLTPETVEQLLTAVRQTVIEEMRKDQGERLIAPSEACRLFQPAISKQTLKLWSDKGYLVRREIGGRVYYRYTDVIEAAKHLKLYK